MKTNNFTKFTDPTLKMKRVVDAAVKWRCCQIFLIVHSVSCSTTHHNTSGRRMSWEPFGHWRCTSRHSF